MLTYINLQPSEYAMVISAAGIPWAVKPLVGLFVDVNNYKRTAIFISGVLIVMPWIIMYFGIVNNAALAALCITASSLGLCVTDVMADALLVTKVRLESNNDIGKLQASCWLSRAVGGLAAAVIGGVCSAKFGAEITLMMTGFIAVPGLLALWSVCMESSGVSCAEALVKTKVVAQTISGDALRRPCIFLFVLNAMPSIGAALGAFFQTELLFTPMEFVVIDVSGHVAHAIGAWIYKKRLRKVSFRRLFKWGIICGIFLESLQMLLITRVSLKAGIPDIVFATAESVSVAIVGQVLTMPLCVIAAACCPEGVEATLYSAVMAISNFGALCSMWGGAWMTHAFGVRRHEYSHMWMLAVACIAASALPLLFISYVHVRPVRIEDNKGVEMTCTPNPVSAAAAVPADGADGVFVDEPLSDTDIAE